MLIFLLLGSHFIDLVVLDKEVYENEEMIVAVNAIYAIA